MLADMFRPLRRYADFRGRALRREYWLFILFSWAVFAAIAGVGAAFGWEPLVNGEWHFALGAKASPLDKAVTWAFMAFLAVMLLPTAAVQVRRYHDRNWSAWNLLWHFVPYIGEIIILVAMIRPGTMGPNRYGPDPAGARVDEWGQALDASGRPIDGWR